MRAGEIALVVFFVALLVGAGLYSWHVWVAMPEAWPGPDEHDDVSAFLEGGDTLLNGSEIYVGVAGT